MRLSEPRIAPLTDAEMDADQRELVAPMAASAAVAWRRWIQTSPIMR